MDSTNKENDNKWYIYGIFAGEECLYVGSTSDINRRMKQHLSKLDNGTHENKSLQAKYVQLEECVESGIESSIEFRVLMESVEVGTLSRYTAEFMWNSYLCPKCAKCVYQGRGGKPIVFGRCSKELAERVIQAYGACECCGG